MNIVIPTESIVSDVNRLTNQLWKLIPMRENQEDWSSHLEQLIVELAGLNTLCESTNKEDFLILLSKLKGLRIEETSFMTYRKVVFECISLLRGILL